MRLSIRHETTYRYRRPVALQEHRLLLFPRGRPDTVVKCCSLSIEPAHDTTWSEDAQGNTVATVRFPQMSDRLSIIARHEIEHSAELWPIFRVATEAHRFPFDYDFESKAELAPMMEVDEGEHGDPVLDWVDGVLRGPETDTLSLLKDVNARLNAGIGYRIRDEEGTQSPADTLRLASGSCRDMAALFIDIVRRLGFAARAVSGYVFDPGSAPGDAGATHAWAEVFLPGAGWIAFDPTSARVGSAGLVAAAVGRRNDRVLPIVGGFAGAPEDFRDMSVDVQVTADGALDEHIS